MFNPGCNADVHQPQKGTGLMQTSNRVNLRFLHEPNHRFQVEAPAPLYRHLRTSATSTP